MKVTPMRAIRAKCLDCCYVQAQEVRLCTVEKCPLYPYRMGHRPKGEEILAEEVEDEKTEASPAFSEQEGYV